VWLVALREFRQARRGRTTWETIEATKDPLVFTVLLEDSAALLGILVAAAGVLLTHATGKPQFDGGASILIGLLLMTVAAVLARESRGLLVGEATDPATEERIRDIASRDPAVARVGRLLTVHFGPRTVVVNAELQFRPELRAGELAEAVARIEQRLKERHPELKYLFLEGTCLTAPR
jgi:divalent metal cation (Fe/Co/Zn/Cd) transporter